MEYVDSQASRQARYRGVCHLNTAPSSLYTVSEEADEGAPLYLAAGFDVVDTMARGDDIRLICVTESERTRGVEEHRQQCEMKAARTKERHHQALLLEGAEEQRRRRAAMAEHKVAHRGHGR